MSAPLGPGLVQEEGASENRLIGIKRSRDSSQEPRASQEMEIESAETHDEGSKGYSGSIPDAEMVAPMLGPGGHVPRYLRGSPGGVVQHALSY